MPLDNNRFSSYSSDDLNRYLAAYHLERDPFLDEGVAGLFFPGGGRKKIIDELAHFTRFASSPVLLLGASGFGKSSVLKEFVCNSQLDVDVAYVDVEIMLGDRQLLEEVMRGFGQPYQGKEALFGQFAIWIREQSFRRRHVVLCFDNTEHLTAEFLSPFFQLSNDSDLCFNLVFAGGGDCQQLLEVLADQNQLLLNTLELPVFNDQDVSLYARYRLGAAGFQRDLPFTEMQIQAATRRSQGNVRQLNDLLRDMLIAGIDNQRLGKQFKFPVVNLVVAFGLSIILLYFAWKGLGQPAPTVELPIALEKVELPQKTANDQIALVGSSDKNIQNATVQNVTNKSVISNNIGKENTVTVVSESHAPATNVDNVKRAEETASVELASREVPVLAAEPAVDVSVNEKHVSTVENVVKSVQPERSDIEDLSDIADIREISKKDSPESKLPKSDGAIGGKVVHKRLLVWPETGYALQVFGTHNAQRARKLVEQYFGEADLLFYETRHNGKPWFVVINGPYSGRQAAQQSIQSLPQSLQRLRPWPRNIASIKSDIARFEQILNREE